MKIAIDWAGITDKKNCAGWFTYVLCKFLIFTSEGARRYEFVNKSL